MAAIEILGLEKTYTVGFGRKKPKQALKPLHLKVEEGEIFGFLGPNGAGKTTTLKLLMGLVFPSAGSARILGMTIDDPRMKAQIGFLPEQPYFYDYLTARELLDYYGQLSGVDASIRSRRVDAVRDRVAIIHQGELRGVGAVADLTSSVHGQVELVWQGTAVPASMRGLGAECHVTGDTVRAVLPEDKQDAAIEILRRERLRLISVTP